MEHFQKFVTTDRLPPGASMTLNAGAVQLALFNINGAYFAIDNTCPHAGAPLAEGYVSKQCVICPWHAWTFDVKTGKSTNMPGACTQTFEVKVENDEILIAVSPRVPRRSARRQT